MRTIMNHVVNPANDKLTISATDEPGAGGAYHEYEIAYDEPGAGIRQFISFQNGAIDEHGINGVTQEALMAVIIDRLRSFQSGPFSCRENALALTHCEDAMHWLHHRTLERMRRGVEGKTVA